MSILWRLLARHRRAVILAIVLLAAFLLMTIQVRHDRAVVSFVRQTVLFTVSPFIKLTALTEGSVSRVWHDYVDLRNLRQENLRLQREAAVLQRRLDQLEEQVLETHQQRRNST